MSHIWAFGVRHLDPPDPQRIRKAPAEALDADHAAGQTGGLLLDEAAAGSMLATTRTSTTASTGIASKTRTATAAHFSRRRQNACPMPIYISNELPPGSLFSGTATSSRIGPMGV